MKIADFLEAIKFIMKHYTHKFSQIPKQKDNFTTMPMKNNNGAIFFLRQNGSCGTGIQTHNSLGNTERSAGSSQDLKTCYALLGAEGVFSLQVAKLLTTGLN